MYLFELTYDHAMRIPNALIFVDFASTDPAAAADFFEAVFGWESEARPEGVFHRLLPGGHFRLEDGSEGPTGNLHMGVHNVENVRPHPDPDGAEPRHLSHGGRTARAWILISPDDTMDRVLDEAERRGAEVLWRNHFWSEFNGVNGAFVDPWGNTFVVWRYGGETRQAPPGTTTE